MKLYLLLRLLYTAYVYSYIITLYSPEYFKKKLE